MRRILNYKPKKLREEMYKWCGQNIMGYKRELYYKSINSAINKACKKGSMLVNVENVVFYRQEMDYLNHLHIVKEIGNREESEHSYNCKKLLFTFIFLMKINKSITESKNVNRNFEYRGKYFKGGQKRYNQLKKLAKLPEKVRINEDIINTLWINHLVTPMFNGLIKLDFMEDIYKIQGNITKEIEEICKNDKDAYKKEKEKYVALYIKDFDSAGWYFDYCNQDKKIAFCKECGKIFRKKSNRQECCSEECSKKQKTEYDKGYQRERYKRKNSRI